MFTFANGVHVNQCKVFMLTKVLIYTSFNMVMVKPYPNPYDNDYYCITNVK